MTSEGGLRISLCYIVKNEAAVLERSLLSAEKAADEIVVVDTGEKFCIGKGYGGLGDFS